MMKVRPLDNIRVLELATFMAGPFCTQILADFGAEVIKIEDPVRGDPGRLQMPTLGGKSALFYTVNRGKKSMTVNLKTPQGQDIYKQLARQSDIIVDQFRPSVMERAGLGYAQLSKENPGLIYCSLSGYGRTGPMNGQAAHDVNLLSMAGILGITGSEGGEPVIPGVSVAGLAGGALYAVTAILLALLHREKTGQGQLCDVSMVDGSVSLLAYALGELAGWGRLPLRGGEGLTGGFACYNIYPTRDGKYLSLGAVEGKFWQEFCSRLNVPEFIELQWYPAEQSMMKEKISALTRTRDREEWLDLFSDTAVCLTPVLDLYEVTSHPLINAREMIKWLPDVNGSGVDLPLTGVPVKLSATPGQAELVFPEHGEHTRTILEQLGYEEKEIAEFGENGVV